MTEPTNALYHSYRKMAVLPNYNLSSSPNLPGLADNPAGILQQVVQAVLGQDTARKIRRNLSGFVRLVIFLSQSGGHVILQHIDFTLEMAVVRDGLLQGGELAHHLIVAVLHPGDSFES